MDYVLVGIVNKLNWNQSDCVIYPLSSQGKNYMVDEKGWSPGGAGAGYIEV